MFCYEITRSRLICFVVLGTIGLFWAFLTVFTTNFYLAVVYIWLVLFCGGATLPGCSGIAVSVVPRVYRAYSSSISLIIFNLFGYFLSVALSGSLMQVQRRLHYAIFKFIFLYITLALDCIFVLPFLR